MAQIITYPKLSTLANDDLLLVSDVSSRNKNTNSLEVDTLAQYIITTNSVIKGGGTLRSIAMFTPTGTEIGDAIMRQNVSATEIEIGGSLLVSGSLEVQDDANINNNLTVDNLAFFNGPVDMGSSLNVGGIAFFNSTAEFDDDVTFNNRIADNAGSFGTAGQMLTSTGSGVQWASGGGGTVTGTGTTHALPVWTDGPAGVIGDSILLQDAAATEVKISGDLDMDKNDILNLQNLTIGPNPSNPVLEVLSEEVVGGNFQAAIISLRANETSTGAPNPRGSVTIHGKNSLNSAGANSLAIKNFKEDADVVIVTNNVLSVAQIPARFKGKGDVQFPNYGSGTFTSTGATFSLAVDANGFIIEEPLPAVPTTTILINGLVNNLASAGSGGFDFMEWVSNITSATQIPVMKTPRDIVLKAVSYSWMGDTALSIGVGEQVAFTIGTIPSGVNPVIANYTSLVSLFDLTNADVGTYANDVVTGLNQTFGAGDVIAVVGQETGTVTPNSGELSLCFEFEVS